MKIVLASDHRGAKAVEHLARGLEAAGHDAEVLGSCGGESCDYPDQALLVTDAVASGDAAFGILVCGSGIGMSMAANKVPGIRAALVHDTVAAQMTRRHNDANVLCLAGDLHAPNELEAIASAFLDASFEGGRHQRRVDKIAAIEDRKHEPKRPARGLV